MACRYHKPPYLGRGQGNQVMTNEVEEASAKLDQLNEAIINSIGDDRPFNLMWGWNCPALNRHDLAAFVSDAATAVRALNPKTLSDVTLDMLREVPTRVEYIIANTIPNLPGGNAGVCTQVIKDFSEWVRGALPPPPPPVASVDWKSVEAASLLPPALLRRLRSIEASLAAIEPRSASVSDDLRMISEARAAAESLPTDLASLGEMRAALEATNSATTESATQIAANLAGSSDALEAMTEKKGEADKILENLGAAYRATTTKGLAASFSLKANILNGTVVAWVVGLMIALLLGAKSANLRFIEMSKLILDSNVPTERLWIQALLTLIGIGAPIWFAWIATKQIGQRFKMAEDYAFKASVAKAYEGYRLEAVRVDPELEKRLFASALDRLEEAPLRLIDREEYGSPLHELSRHPAFQRALDQMPELKEAVKRILPKADQVGRDAEGAVKQG